MGPSVTNLTIADGQVAATATQITTGKNNNAGRLNVKFCNVGSNEETLTLTVSRNGGTARRICRKILAPNEEFKLGGLALNQSDSLLAATTNASSVDYTVSMAAKDSPYTEEVFDDAGRVKSLPYILEQINDAND